MGSGEEEDDGGLTPTEDDDDVQRLSGLPESVSVLVNRGYASRSVDSVGTLPAAFFRRAEGRLNRSDIRSLTGAQLFRRSRPSHFSALPDFVAADIDEPAFRDGFHPFQYTPHHVGAPVPLDENAVGRADMPCGPRGFEAVKREKLHATPTAKRNVGRIASVELYKT